MAIEATAGGQYLASVTQVWSYTAQTAKKGSTPIIKKAANAVGDAFPASAFRTTSSPAQQSAAARPSVNPIMTTEAGAPYQPRAPSPTPRGLAAPQRDSSPKMSRKPPMLRGSGGDHIVFRSLKFWGRPVSTGMMKVRLRVRRPKHDANTFGTYNCQR